MRDSATVVNVGTETWTVERVFGHYVIPGVKPPFPYNTMRVFDRVQPIDMGDGRYISFPVLARDIAKDITQDLEQHGVFVAAGEKPTGDELSKARSGMEDYYRKLVVDGDNKYAANRDMRINGITDVHRRAALYLGEEREWAYVAHKKVDCEFCGSKVMPGAAVCNSCRAILDPEKAIAAGIINQEQFDTIKKNRARIAEKRAGNGRKPETKKPERKLAHATVPGAAPGLEPDGSNEDED